MIFDEKSYAEEILLKGFSTYMNFKDLSILAKYFKYLGKNRTQIKKDLIDFCYKYNPEFNEIIHNKYIEGALNATKKYKLVLPMTVNITKGEIEIIKTLHNYKYEKIIFVMLVMAKFYKDNCIFVNDKTLEKYKINIM
jgi:hypothetical protein